MKKLKKQWENSQTQTNTKVKSWNSEKPHCFNHKSQKKVRAKNQAEIFRNMLLLTLLKIIDI